MIDEQVQNGNAILLASVGRDGRIQHSLGGLIVIRVVVAECPFKHARAGTLPNRPAGETQRHLPDVRLRVAAIHAQRVQFHQFACVVLVGIRRRAHVIVQVIQHRRAACTRVEQVRKCPQRVGANHIAIISRLVILHGHDIDVEVVRPQLNHALKQLPLAEGRSQNRRFRQFVSHKAKRLWLKLRIRHVQRRERGNPCIQRGVVDSQVVELIFQIPLVPKLPRQGQFFWRCAEGDAINQFLEQGRWINIALHSHGLRTRRLHHSGKRRRAGGKPQQSAA